MKPPHHMLPGQPPAWQTSLGQGPLGHVSQAWLDALLRPTANPESSFCISELSHFSQLCLREAPAFSRNLVTCSHLLHLYSNIGTTLISHYRSVHFDSHRRLLHTSAHYRTPADKLQDASPKSPTSIQMGVILQRPREDRATWQTRAGGGQNLLDISRSVLYDYRTVITELRSEGPQGVVLSETCGRGSVCVLQKEVP